MYVMEQGWGFGKVEDKHGKEYIERWPSGSLLFWVEMLLGVNMTKTKNWGGNHTVPQILDKFRWVPLIGVVGVLGVFPSTWTKFY
jgi:hypothetical protein